MEEDILILLWYLFAGHFCLDDGWRRGGGEEICKGMVAY